MKIVLAGASGLVGNRFLAAADAEGHDVVLVGRRALENSDREIITDFVDPPTLPAADAAVCTLGTTMARAGSRDAFYAVDHDAVLCFARAAIAAAIPRFLVVTAVGANARAAVYYSRVKGEVERDLEALAFQRLDIAQPGLLLGPRSERRPVETMLQRVDPVLRCVMVGPFDRYAGIAAQDVAGALLRLCETANEPGVFRHRNRAHLRLAQS
jgi:uncharacterized protein YbjT (DUF2867 family)